LNLADCALLRYAADAYVALAVLTVDLAGAEAIFGMGAVENAGVVVIATEWPEFRDLDWAALGARMCARTIIDGRRLLDPARMAALGFRYEAVGAPLPAEARAESIGVAGNHIHGPSLE